MRDFTLKRKWERFILTIVFCIAICAAVFAQNATITGKVIDATTNEAIIGAAIQIQGTTIGVGTDIRGNFKLSGPANSVLIIKSVGYDPVTINATLNVPMSIKLTPTNSSLNEVVVVGYGTEKKASLTGSVATVGAKAFQDRGIIDNPISALQGTVPGTSVTRTSAAPGRSGWNLQIEGATSVNGSDPLYIIYSDGSCGRCRFSANYGAGSQS
jgi:hypothetical protein